MMAAASESVAAALLPSALATASRKHKRSGDDFDAAPKRVRFAETSLGLNGSLEPANDPPPSALDHTITLDMFSKFVVNALDERAAGRNVHYNELRRKFRADPRAGELSDEEPPSSNELRMTLHALTGVVSRLGDNCKQLVSDIVACKWVGRDQMFVGEYVRFLGNLVSAHASYMSEVTRMLVGNFGYLSSSEGQIQGYETVARSLMYERVHYALQFILDLVPTAAVSTLWPHLTENYPHRMEKKGEHTAYLTNILRVIDYVPALRQRILALVTERTIRIDVEVQGYLDDLDDEELAQLEADVQDDYEADDDATSVVSDDSNMSDDEEEPLPTTMTSIQTIRETADKLDSLLAILFGHYSLSFPNDSAFEPSDSESATFEMLHRFFTTTIMPTHRSRFTQFLIFWAAQRSPQFSDRFCVSLIDKAFDNARTVRQRTQAASYLASYVARAKLMPTEDIRIIVRVLCRWLGEFIDQRSIECTGPDANRWAGFYAVAQAVMYIFCFRHRELRELDPESIDDDMDEDDINPPASALSATSTSAVMGGRWTPGLDIMNKVITSKFNPLLVCAKHVVDMFAKVASDNEFLFCWSVLDQNKRRGALPRISNGSLPAGMMVFQGMTNGGAGTLDAFFPFDPPTMCPKMKNWIDDLYVEWSNDDEEVGEDDYDDEEDSMMIGGDDEDEDEGTESDDD
ncbi:RNA polymerase I-specific transcription initiation factor RRN3 [Ascodesmis nigricans]|uniref:RNA polymerase I-specific transcription initiation factor RRN3 n=1 Tax=Ascodesmis nigricans TaxID=341454 RepID=A0A4S2N238_9PEZI|nr:RNA polymerase I-specific transcription initiation factor RRN3 [Ascodesmis nigricans]